MSRYARIITVLSVLTGMFVPHAAVIAYNAGQINTVSSGIPDIGNVANVANQIPGVFNQYTGLQLGDVLEASGLQGAKAKLCTAQNVLNGVAALQDNWRDRLTAELSRALQETAATIIQELAICALHAIPYVGAAFPECSIEAAGRGVEQNLKQQLEDIKVSFLGNCVSTAQLNDMMEFARRVINEQGPGGSPAYVTNWVNDVFTEPDRRAVKRMWVMLANTDICPYFRDEVLNYYSVPVSYRENPPPLDPNEFNTTADVPFMQRAACTLPADFNPAAPESAEQFAARGGYAGIQSVARQQNNLEGFMQMADAELRRQRSVTVQAAVAEATSGGGFRSIHGNDAETCAVRDPGTGDCIEYGLAKQPPANAAVIGAIPIQVPVQQVLQQIEPGQPTQDMMAVFANHTLGMLNRPLPFRIQFGLQNDPDVFTPPPTPTPNPSDAQCGGGDARCQCVDSSLQSPLRSVTGPAMTRVQQSRPELFSPAGSSQVAPGKNREYLEALCAALSESPGQCVPHPTQDDKIVLRLGGQTVSIDVLTSQGGVMSGGGLPVAICDAGVQD